MAHIILNEETKNYWHSSNSIFSEVIQESMDSMEDSSSGYETLLLAQVNGGFSFDSLEESEKHTFLESTTRLYKKQKELVDETPKDYEGLPYMEGMLNKLEELIGKIEAVLK